MMILPGQASAQFGFESLIDSLDEDRTGDQAEPSAAAETAAPAGLLGAFGDDAALVESIENAPNSGVEFMDTVQPGRVIELGAQGVLVVSYFNSCIRETITGGQVIVGRERSSFSGGRLSSEIVDCQGATPIITAEVGEAGAAVKRVTPFDPEDWKEWTVRTPRPIFKWQAASPGEPVSVTVVYLDSAQFRIVWKSITTDAYLAYPKEAPPLETGMPYLVQIDGRAAGRLGAVFSIDPWLDVADNAANRIIPIDR